MLAYIVRRLLLIIPTLVGIMVVNFVVIQAAPGGPVEQMIAQLTGSAVGATERFAGGSAETGTQASRMATGSGDIQSKYRGAQGLDPEFVKQIEKLFGFDKPMHERFFHMMGNYFRFDFGQSYFRDRDVVDLVIEKLPVSISLGLWTMLIVYGVSIPLGIRKATHDGTRFDAWSSAAIIFGYAIPGFLFAVMLIVLFAGGSFWQIFPLRGLTSENWSELPWDARVRDYFWHIALPILSMVIGGFATLTMLTKNSFLEEIRKHYVATARAKGLNEDQVLYGHVFRNAMLIPIAGFPGHFISVLFTGSVLTEVIFSLDGLGLLGFEAAINRDFPVMFGTLFFFTLLGLLLNLVGDLMYVVVDPRIDFESRDA